MCRKSVLCLTAFLLLVRLAAAEDVGRPNVLLVTADDLGLQLSCYGDTTVNTPAIDALAAQSVQFEYAYVTQASCSPSRSSLFSGLYPHGNGHYGLANAGVGFKVHERLLPFLLPNLLKQSGYQTGIIGKLHVNPESAFQFDFRRNEGFGSRDIARQIKQASEFLAARDPNDPWFLMFNVFDPHVARKSLGNGRRGPQYFPNQVQGIPKSPITPNNVKPWPWQGVDDPAQLEKIAGYYNCVQRVDKAIGSLIGLLESQDEWDNTLVIFLGDHGPPFARGKTSCYEAGLRVPFLVKWPGVSQPHISSRLVSSVDIYPTILEAAQIQNPYTVHGRSLAPVLARPSEIAPVTWREYLAAEFHFHGATPFFPRRAITNGRFKLIHNMLSASSEAISGVDGDKALQFAQALPPNALSRLALERLKNPPEWELFDLQNDPNEFENLAMKSEFQSQFEDLQNQLRIWQRETNDPFVQAEFRSQIQDSYRK